MESTLGIIGILLGFSLLIFLIMRGFNIFLTVFICTLTVALFTQTNIYEAFKVDFMAGFSGFFKNYFLLFLVGSLLAKAMDKTGAAKSIANSIIRFMGVKWAFASVPLACGILCFGGVSAHVCAFCVFPIALQVFKAADLPRRCIPGALCFGCSTWAMIAPGAVQIHNAVPSQTLGTPYTAGLVNGWLACSVMLIVGVIWLKLYLDKAKNAGEHFHAIEGDDVSDNISDNLPHPLLALFPLLATIVMVNLKKDGKAFIPVELAVLAGTVLCVVLLYRYREENMLSLTFKEGLEMALLAVTNTCAVVGFGGVVSATPQFATIVNSMINLPGPKLLSLLLGTTVIAGICGSASGGLGVAAPILGPAYLNMGIGAQSVHRIMALSSSALDSLPHNGYIVTVTNGLCRETHKSSYGLTFRLTVIVPFIGSLIGVILFSLLPNLP